MVKAIEKLFDVEILKTGLQISLSLQLYLWAQIWVSQKWEIV